MAKAYFQSDLFDFLTELADNNRRDWFDANKKRYELHVKEAAFGFISDFGPHLREISPRFRAIPKAVGGSLFRIYRDTRFSKNKTPYKTHVGIHFRHEQAKDAHAPGFYLHLEPSGCFAGVGIWHPPSPALKMIREHIVAKPGDWTAARDAKPFQKSFFLRGESLKTVPRGFDAEHELIEDLRRKDFIGVTEFPADAVTKPDFLDLYASRCRDGAPLMRFLCDALDVPF
ncbi:MAG: DUF2461 domain-containing protein [Thermoanaerobaculia bacterium]|nr:DUF2461 domain-containing protein [Thermoanaerobaculia bacterium]